MASAMISKLRTENFETWKAAYDAGEAIRREHGVRGTMVTRDAADPNLVTIVTRFDSVAAAKAMIDSAAWQAAAKSAKSPILEASFVDIADERAY